MFILYMETLYIFLKMIEILVIIFHLHLLFTCLYISYMVKTFCLWKRLDFDGSFFTGQPFVEWSFLPWYFFISIITLNPGMNIAVIR